ncbi:MAG: hydroxyacid-oxoacid transhydrogenase [Pseudomonadota bacterium]|nr:hydroxyacid-oxoacid transhydrogenase [Pseudomonadota bacterium]
MSCCHYYAPDSTGDTAFSIDVAAITYGAGSLREVGDYARDLGMTHVALFTDKVIGALEHLAIVRDSLGAAGINVALYDEARVEPTDDSFRAAAKFASEGNFDGYVSVGGGSVIDTAKAANLYATYPADFLTYVNAPIGGGVAVPGPVKPHIACPTTCGTGSECTGIAIFDLLVMKAKTGIVSRYLRPTRGIVDPETTRTLPRNVIAASGFDVLSHALESYTAQPFTRRDPAAWPSQRPQTQGANPWSDVGCLEALRLLGSSLERAVTDEDDHDARADLMFAATLAGIAFGNSGCHLPHGMSYSVSGLVRDFRPDGYPDHEPMVPHGMSVIVNAPAVFRFTAEACPERHLKAAACLGADTGGAGLEDAGEVTAGRIIELMKATGVPNGIGGVGYGEADIAALTEGSFPQKRLIDNAPRDVTREQLGDLYGAALRYW